MIPPSRTPSGRIPGDPQDRDALAAEYVLGTLEGAAAAEVAEALTTDVALRVAVDAWEARLAPLLALAVPEAPPAELWDRIEAALPRPAALRPPVVAEPRHGWFDLWKAWAIGATAVAAGLAVLLVRPAEPPPRLMTVLLTQRDQPAWVVESGAGGALRLAALNAPAVASDKVLELWSLAPGATAPTSLGVIPPSGRFTVSPRGPQPQDGMLIEISLEPPGGSPIGRPTGPVLFIGRLTAAGAT